MARRILALAFVGLAIGAVTCGELRTEPQVVVLWVAPYEVDCEGVIGQKCLLVSADPDEDWEYLFDGISGFTFEPGYRWKLRVRRDVMEKPARDASTTRLVLIEILEKARA